jgi:hypothetical protein
MIDNDIIIFIEVFNTTTGTTYTTNSFVTPSESNHSDISIVIYTVAGQLS